MSTFDQRYHFNNNVLPTITLEHAKTWKAEQDPTCWIEYTLLDPNALPRSDDMIARVESRLEHLLSREIEDQILEKLVDDALAVGCFVSVNSGEDWEIKRSQDRAKILAATRATDEDALILYDADGLRVGTVCLIYGNGYDLISDCSDNEGTRAILEGAEALAESLQG